MSYITWEQYSSLSGRITDEGTFEKFLSRAEIKINTVTHMRAKAFEGTYDAQTATDFQKQVHGQIQSCVCDLIDAIDVHEASGMGTGISSVSNDGYSESYKITTAEEREGQLSQIARSGLSGTGLAGAL